MRVRSDRLAVRDITVADVLRALMPLLDVVDRACAHDPLTPGLKDIVDSLRGAPQRQTPASFRRRTSVPEGLVHRQPTERGS